MTTTSERLQHVVAQDGTVHISFPTALLTLCAVHDNQNLPATKQACGCVKCITNMHALVRVQAGIAPREPKDT